MVSDFFDPAKVMRLTAQLLSGASGALANGFLILLTVVFIMLDSSGLARKLTLALDNPHQTLAGFSQFTESVNRYIGIKTIFSLVTGMLVWLWLMILGVNHPVLWGLLAFLLWPARWVGGAYFFGSSLGPRLLMSSIDAVLVRHR